MLRFAPSFIRRGTAAAARRATSTASGGRPAGSGPGGSDWAAVMLKLDTMATKEDLKNLATKDLLAAKMGMRRAASMAEWLLIHTLRQSPTSALAERFPRAQMARLEVYCLAPLIADVGGIGLAAAHTLCALLLPALPGTLASLLQAASAPGAFGDAPVRRADDVSAGLQRAAARGGDSPLARFVLQQPGSWAAMMDAGPELAALLLQPEASGATADADSNPDSDFESESESDSCHGLLPALTALAELVATLRACDAAPRTTAEALACAPLHHVLDRAVVEGPAGVALLTHLVCGAAGVTTGFTVGVRGGWTALPSVDGARTRVSAGDFVVWADEERAADCAEDAARAQLRALLCRAIVHRVLTHYEADAATWSLRPKRAAGAPVSGGSGGVGSGYGAAFAAASGGQVAAADAAAPGAVPPPQHYYSLHTTLCLPLAEARERGAELLVSHMGELRSACAPSPPQSPAGSPDASGSGGGGDTLAHAPWLGDPLPLPWPDATRWDGRGVDARCTYAVGVDVVGS